MAWPSGEELNSSTRLRRLSGGIPSSYTVLLIDSTYYAECNIPSGTEYSGTAAHTVINNALNSLTVGRSWKEKVLLKGDFTLTSAIQVPGYTTLEIQGRLRLDDSANCNAIENKNAGSGSDQYIEVLGGHIDGNKANNSTGCGVKMNTTWYSKFVNLSIKDAPEHGVLLQGITGTAGCYYNDFYGLTVLSSGGDGIKLTTNGATQKANENRFYGVVTNSHTGYGVNIDKGNGNKFYGLEASGNDVGIYFNEKANYVYGMRGESNTTKDVVVDSGVTGSVYIFALHGDASLTDPNSYLRQFNQLGMRNIPIRAGAGEVSEGNAHDITGSDANLRIRQLGNYELILDGRKESSPGNSAIHLRTSNAAGAADTERITITGYEDVASVKFRNCLVYLAQGIEAHTSNDTLVIGERGSVHTNLGAGGAVTLTLPQNAKAGDFYEFVVMTAQQLRVDPGAAGAIYINGAKQTDDKYIWADDEGESVKLVCDGNGDWIALYTQGTWSVEP